MYSNGLRRLLPQSLLSFHLMTLAWIAVMVFVASFLYSQQHQWADADAFLENSDTIFVGRVVSSASLPGVNGDAVLSRYAFEIREILKGAPLAFIEIIECAARVGGSASSAFHLADYREGQDYLVFSDRDLLGRARTLAGNLGRLPVISHLEGSPKLLLPVAHPLAQTFGLDRGNALQDLNSVTRAIEAAVR